MLKYIRDHSPSVRGFFLKKQSDINGFKTIMQQPREEETWKMCKKKNTTKALKALQVKGRVRWINIGHNLVLVRSVQYSTTENIHFESLFLNHLFLLYLYCLLLLQQPGRNLWSVLLKIVNIANVQIMWNGLLVVARCSFIPITQSILDICRFHCLCIKQGLSI